MTPADKAAALAAIDQANQSLAAARAMVIAWPASEEPPPPTPTELVPAGLTATGEAGAVRVRWQSPTAAAPLGVFIAWGSPAGFLSQANVAPGATEYAVGGLQAGTEYTFDVAYQQPNGAVGKMARVTGTPIAGVPVDPPVPPSEDYPAGGSWQSKRDWVKSVAGAEGQLRVIDSGAALVGAGLPGTWANGRWTCPECQSLPFRDLDVRGLVYYTGQQPLLIENCRTMGIQYAETSGKQGGRIRQVTVVRNAALGLGQGAINMWGQTDWLVERCDLSGFSDGMQVSGNGMVRDTWVHDLVYGNTPSGIPTHNDGIQNYGGTTRLERVVFEMGGKAGSTNGALFCSTPSAAFIAADLFAEVTRADVNLLHAWESPQGIVVNGGRLSPVGRLIGKVVLNGVVRE